MMSDDKFCLHWKDFEANMTVALKDLREEKDFFDVTIACEDNQIQAHKVILSACSTFFRNLLRRNPHQHPLLYLKGVQYKDLLGILDFMYNGEVNVAEEELKQFLAVAADLKVKGLTQKMAMPTIPTIKTAEKVVKKIPVKQEPDVKEPPQKRKRSTIASKVEPVVEQIDTYQEMEETTTDIIPFQEEETESPIEESTPNPDAMQFHTPLRNTASSEEITAPTLPSRFAITEPEAEKATPKLSSRFITATPEGDKTTPKLLSRFTPDIEKTSQKLPSRFNNPKTEAIPIKALQTHHQIIFQDDIKKSKAITPESFMSPLRNSTAWRCTLCKKISSNKKVALVHLKIAHPEKDTN